MVYGSGFAKSIDIVADEMTNRVLASEECPDLSQRSGAVNQSLADIFGTLIELRPRGTAQLADRGSAPGLSARSRSAQCRILI